jgi:hypothetical protein
MLRCERVTGEATRMKAMQRAAIMLLVLAVLAIIGSAPAQAAAPGTLDLSFGIQGIALTGFGAGVDKACAMALQPDGKYVLAGTHEAWETPGQGPRLWQHLIE